MTGRLTTHVLDTARGLPAADVALELWRVAPDGARTRLHTTRTDADGRTAEPLLAGSELTAGTYEIVFAVGAYFAATDTPALTSPPFLDQIPIRFSITDPGRHHHIPLLVSPWAYSTYRGS